MQRWIYGAAALLTLCAIDRVQAADLPRPATVPDVVSPVGPRVGAIKTLPPTVATPSGSIVVGHLVLPKPPAKPGCFQHHPGRSDWEEIRCASADVAQHIPHGDQGVTVAESTPLGQPPPPAALNGEVDVDLVKLGGVTDSNYGANRFSIQLNPQAFTIANGHQIGVQFVFDSYTYQGRAVNLLDIQQNDATAQTYPQPQHPTLVTITRNPKAGDVVTLGGGVSGGNVQLIAVIPWAATTGGPDSLMTQEPDNYGFAANERWPITDGGMIGAGFGSKATFTKACVTTTLRLFYVPLPNPLPTLVAIPSGGIFGGTQESNNLTEVNTPLATWRDGNASIAFHGVSSDWTKTGTADCYPADVPPPVLSNTSSPVQETDMPASAKGGAMAELCKSDAFMVGLDVKDGRLLCSQAMPLATRLVPDTGATELLPVSGTLHKFHVCPANSAMIGLIPATNALLCGALPASGYVPLTGYGAYQANPPGDTEVPQPNHPGQTMHGCDPSGQGTPLVMAGADTAGNVFVCMNAGEVPRLQ